MVENTVRDTCASLGMLFLLLSGMAGCAGPTPYQRQIDGRGYHEEQLDDKRFRVMFTANTRTPSETVENYVLYRAAELTLETGNDAFIVLDQGDERLASFKPSSLQRVQKSYEGPDGAQDPIFETVATGSVRPTVSNQVELVIEVQGGAKPKDEINAFDARELISRLKPLLIFPGETRR
jgi:hypothetical protein